MPGCTYINRIFNMPWVLNMQQFWIYIQLQKLLTTNSSQLEWTKYVHTVFLNSTLQVPQKVSLLNNIVNNKKYLYGHNIDPKITSVWEYMVYYILLSQHIPIYV